jgi:hypothetical protein
MTEGQNLKLKLRSLAKESQESRRQRDQRRRSRESQEERQPPIYQQLRVCENHSQTAGMQKLRADGHLTPNSFASFERVENTFKIKDHGDAQAYLFSDRLRQTSKRLVKRGVVPSETEFAGWLGAYHRLLANPTPEPEPNRAALTGREKILSASKGR